MKCTSYSAAETSRPIYRQTDEEILRLKDLQLSETRNNSFSFRLVEPKKAIIANDCAWVCVWVCIRVRVRVRVRVRADRQNAIMQLCTQSLINQNKNGSYKHLWITICKKYCRQHQIPINFLEMLRSYRKKALRSVRKKSSRGPLRSNSSLPI